MAISDSELAGWQLAIEALRPGLRGGPQYQVGRARYSRSEFDLAAAEFLWVATIYDEHEPTAARATLDAAEALVRAGRPDDAMVLFRETSERFAWSPAAVSAKSRLAELEKSDDSAARRE
jgi:TolA-binding protein